MYFEKCILTQDSFLEICFGVYHALQMLLHQLFVLVVSLIDVIYARGMVYLLIIFYCIVHWQEAFGGMFLSSRIFMGHAGEGG